MSDTVLRDEIAEVVSEHADRPEDADPQRWSWCADKILAIPAIKAALDLYAMRDELLRYYPRELP